MPRGWAKGKNQPKWHTSIYDRWRNMWARCKNPSNKDYPNYKDCKIDERYRLLSNYVNDVMQLDNFDLLCLYPNEYHVDKDKLDPNNRCYFFEHLSIISYKENIGERHKRNSNLKRLDAIKGINILDGSIVYFDNVRQASDKGFYPSLIVKCLEGQRKSHKGYRWEYLKEDDNEDS